jgi:hypothetical protein
MSSLEFRRWCGSNVRVSALIDFPAPRMYVEFYKACCAGVFPTVVARSAGSDNALAYHHRALSSSTV